MDNSPHDIDFNADGTKVYVVGAATDNIKQFVLSTAYDISTIATSAEKTSKVFGDQDGNQETDPRGISFNNDGSKIFIIGATRDSIIEINLSSSYDIGTMSTSKSISVNEGSFNEANPTTIRFNNTGTKVFFTGESTDDIFEINLSGSFDIHSRTTSQSLSLNEIIPGTNTFNSFDFNH